MAGNIIRKKTRSIRVGGVMIGGDAPVVVQSMTSTDTRDIGKTVDQIRKLVEAGCELVRVAVPDRKAAAALRQIKDSIQIPLVADIHFNPSLAIEAIRNGADGVRINPGNIGPEGAREVFMFARDNRRAVRIGINSGSLEREIAEKYGGPTPEALVESAVKSIQLAESLGVADLKISLKSSDVATTIAAYRLMSQKTDYPLHLGVTEAGTLLQAAIKSSIGLGTLLLEGIGDTIRVSVTGDPLQEISVAYGILRALKIREIGPDIISCPTCGRCAIDLTGLAHKVEQAMKGRREPIKIAIMGCVVNGPGEAAEADIGIAGGKGEGVLFKKGKIIRKIKEEEFLETLLGEIEDIIK